MVRPFQNENRKTFKLIGSSLVGAKKTSFMYFLNFKSFKKLCLNNINASLPIEQYFLEQKQQ